MSPIKNANTSYVNGVVSGKNQGTLQEILCHIYSLSKLPISRLSKFPMCLV